MISWIKLDINILDDAKIKIIRSHPNGDSVVLLWIGLLCLAMKSSRPGTIEISDGLPYTVDDLSNLFNIDKKTVEMGLALFVKYRMIETFDGGSIDVINFSKHQKIEEIERKRELTRIRVEKYRDKTRQCNALLTHDSVTVTLTDKDKDLDKDKEIKRYYSQDFLSFWSSYPKKSGSKKAAFVEWNKMNGTRPSIETIIEAINQQIEWREKANGEFRPEWKDPERWLKNRMWEAEIEIAERTKDDLGYDL